MKSFIGFHPGGGTTDANQTNYQRLAASTWHTEVFEVTRWGP